MNQLPPPPPFVSGRSVRFLASGPYRTLVDGRGIGFSSFGSCALTPSWPSGPSGGSRVYFQEPETGLLWSSDGPPRQASPNASWKPGVIGVSGETLETSTLREVCLVEGMDLELHYITLRNLARHTRHFEITTAIDVALNDPAAHAAHPVFSKLFLETEFAEPQRCLLVRRRPRSPHERYPLMFHALSGAELCGYETDRVRFWGRGSTPGIPYVLERGHALSGTTGSVLDPVLALRALVTVKPGQDAQMIFVIGAAADRSTVLERVRRIGERDWALDIRSEAETSAREDLRRLELSENDAAYLQAFGGAVLRGEPSLRVQLNDGAAFDPGGLAPLSLGPDVPWIVFHAGADAGRERMLQACRYWKGLGLPIRIMVIASGALSSREPQEDGYQLVMSDGLSRETLALLDGGSRVVIRDRFPVLYEPGAHGATPISVDRKIAAITLPRSTLDFDNGTGGFTPDRTEYVIRVSREDGHLVLPPRPWINVIANETFGFLTSETGAGTTWNGNSREHRLTPWANDPLLDPLSEAFYVRDEATGAFGSILPMPSPAGAYESHVGWGYSTWRARLLDLDIETTAFVPRRDPLKITRVRLENHGDRPRKVSLFSYYRLILCGWSTEATPHIHTALDQVSGAVLARHVMSPRGDCRAFAALAADETGPVHVTADRRGFLGDAGDLSRPDAVAGHRSLDGRVGSGLDPCIAQQAQLDLPPGGVREIAFLFGEGATLEDVRELVARYRSVTTIEQALADVREFWTEGVAGVNVSTPVPELDVLVNGWLPYQTLSCRIWGRSALYQSGGAYGFRDQLQDAAALVHLWPEMTRAQILLHAAHQFEEGDVLHWWHPPESRGLRTRFADDLLWLPYVTAGYIEATGDRSVLEERVGFRRGRLLKEGEDEAYIPTEASENVADVYEHCTRAIDRSLGLGVHGLPLFGTGDWNDGMNRVGREGRGESVWMGFFLCSVFDAFLPFCDARGDADRAARYHAHRESLHVALNEGGWDGAWYRRGYYDDGTPLGSAAGDECRIDALAQAWAVLSGVA
ncbi:MAG TPA: glycosyl transferase, partial [Candidatus Eisenbacteria bacterium]|nr:glycosyl transferase [Candidatus Eisenbacteria bacterium]